MKDMAFRYKDEKIPQRPAQGGKTSRSVFDADNTQSDRIAESIEKNSRWTIITQEELFSGPRRDQHRAGSRETRTADRGQDTSGRRYGKDITGRGYTQDLYESDQFTGLIRMMRNYQVTDRGRRLAFLEQAEWMEAYEEHGQIPDMEFYHQYVGYQEMDVWELHGYFSWRTGFRRGERVPYIFEFMRLHAAELINLIGVTNMPDAFERLLALQAIAFRGKDPMRGSSLLTGRSLQTGSSMMRGGSLLSETGLPRRMYEAPVSDRMKLRGILSDFVVIWGAVFEQSQENSISDPEQEQKDGVSSPKQEQKDVYSIQDLLQEYGISNPEREAETITLLHYAESNDAAIYRTIQNLASNRALNSEFLRQAGEDGWRVIARVFRRVCAEQKLVAFSGEDDYPNGRPTLAERILGQRRTTQRDLFPMMPYETHVEEGYHIEVSPALSYTCKDGHWYRSDYPLLRDEAALRELNDLVRECERILRKKLHYKNQLPDRMHNPKLAKLIAEEIDHWLKEKAQRNRPEVRVDLSRLGSIRDQAALTRERLLEGTEEGAESDALLERMEEGAESDALLEKMKEGAEADELRENMNGPASTNREYLGIFSEQEVAFLQLLLDGSDGAVFFRNHKILPAVFVDTINEKAFDEIGDSIVEEAGAGWQLVEDYIGDVAALLS